nr:chloroplastic group IIB intron splicing facilitator CRS2-B, chloroplastic [Ipomoea batatas]
MSLSLHSYTQKKKSYTVRNRQLPLGLPYSVTSPAHSGFAQSNPSLLFFNSSSLVGDRQRDKRLQRRPPALSLLALDFHGSYTPSYRFQGLKRRFRGAPRTEAQAKRHEADASYARSMLYSLSPAKSCVVPYPRCPCSHPRHLAPVRIRASASLPEPNGAKVEYTPWLVAGLGNPGNKYHGTRHNVGFEMIDQISQEEGILLNTIQSKALIGIGSIGEVPVVLAKPQTYMNFSGESGEKCNGTSGWLPSISTTLHRSVCMTIFNHIGSNINCGVTTRHRISENIHTCEGIGNPPGAMDMKAFLLQKFSETERKQVDEALKEGAEAVRMLVKGKGSCRSTREGMNSVIKQCSANGRKQI